MYLKSIKIMLPISILSVLFSQSSVFDGLLNLLENCGSIRAERTYAFLLLNGLLALLIKSSGLSKRVPESSNSSLKTATETTEFEDGEVLAGDHEEKDKYAGCDETSDILSHEEEENDVLAADDEVDEDGIPVDEDDTFADEEEDDQDEIVLAADDEVDEDDICVDEDDTFADEEENDEDEIVAMEEEEEEEDHDFVSDDDDEEEVVEWGISVEELNSKCDDFIKNMRHML